ncbi:hypothetical protein pb186bvf_007195 [Paramecium bursaria]
MEQEIEKERLFWPSDLFKNQDQLITMLDTELYNQVPDSLLYYFFNNYKIKDLKQKVDDIQYQINCIIQEQQLYLNYYDIIQDEVKLKNKQIKQNLYANYLYQVLKFDCKLNHLELFNKNGVKMIPLSEACIIIPIVKYGFKQQSYKYQYFVFCIIMLMNQNKSLMNNSMIDDLYQKAQDKLNFHFQEFIQQLIKVLQLSQEFEDMIKSLLNNLQLDYVYEQMLDNQIPYSDDESIKKIINQYYQSFLKQVIFQKLEEEINKL